MLSSLNEELGIVLSYVADVDLSNTLRAWTPTQLRRALPTLVQQERGAERLARALPHLPSRPSRSTPNRFLHLLSQGLSIRPYMQPVYRVLDSVVMLPLAPAARVLGRVDVQWMSRAAPRWHGENPLATRLQAIGRYAAREGNARALVRVAAAGVNLDGQAPLGGAVVHIAAARNHPESILAIGPYMTPAQLMARDMHGRNAADIAAEFNHAGVIQALHGAGVGLPAMLARNSNGHSPLCIAAQHNNLHVIRVFGALGADAPLLMARGEDGSFNAAEVAAQAGHAGAIMALHEAGVGPAAFMEWHPEGFSTALLAAIHGHSLVFVALRWAGVGLDAFVAESPHGETCVHVAARHGQVDVIEVLRDMGARLDVPVRGGVTPLHEAAHSGQAGVVARLHAGGVRMNTPTDEGWAAIHLAAGNDHAGVIGALLTAGANLNATGPRNVTPALLAVRSGSLGAIDALRAAGASFDMPSFDGETARAVARLRGLDHLLPAPTGLHAGPATPSACVVM